MFLKYIQNVYKENRVIFKNFTYLSILQIARIVIPILIIPILIQKLGIDKYGIIIFAQALVFHFMMVINFGFELSATRKISISRNSYDNLSEIVSSVFIIKIALFLILTIIYSLMIFLVPIMNDYFYLFLFSFLFCLQDIFIPIWFFQGLEKMKFITIVDVISRLIFLLLIIFFIDDTKDYILVPIFRFLGVLVSGFISVYLIFFKEKIKFKYINIKILFSYFTDSLPFFYSRFFTAINDRVNILLLGSFVGIASVAYYDFVYKIISGINVIFGTLIKVLYPHISITKNLNKAKKIFYFNVLSSIVIFLFLCLFSKQIIIFIFKSDPLNMYRLFYTLGLMLPLVSIGWCLGDLYLAAFGYSREYSYSSIYSTLLYFSIIFLLFLFNLLELDFLVMALVLKCIFVDIYRFYYCKKYQLF